MELVDLAADLDCHYISAVVRGQQLLPLRYPPFSLKDDPALRKDLLAAMNHRGVAISLGDGFLVRPGAEMAAFGADLDVLAELRVPRINVVSLDPDLGRTFDQFAALTELAAQRNIRTAVEPVPGLTVGDLPTGSGATDLAALDPNRIGYAQLCDSTLQARSDNYADEAVFERMVPGEGELPLSDILSVLPSGIVIELEVPGRSLALAGVSPLDRLRPCVDAARRLLSELSTGRTG